MKPFRLLLIIFLVTFCTCRNAPLALVSLLTARSLVQSSPVKQATVNSFDLAVIRFFQGFSHKSRLADDFFRFFTYNNFFQGGVLLAAFWWLWYLPGDGQQSERRVKIILALLSSFIAIFFGRAVVHITPERLRPLDNPELSLVLPYGVNSGYVDHLSSFPSDHAVLFYSIATGLFLVSKRMGLLAFIYTTVFIVLTRVYFCYHYATDVLAGAIVGMSVTYFICQNLWFRKMGEKIYQFSVQKPQFFYPVFFLISYQLANLFEELRNAMVFFWRMV